MSSLTITVHFLGPFEVYRFNKRIPDTAWCTIDARLLLAYLVRHGPTHRERLMDIFWPTADPDQAAMRLRNAVRHARAALATPDTPGTAYLIHCSGVYQLHPDVTCHTDVAAFETHLAQARQADDTDAALAGYAAAVDLYRGHFLAGFYADWVLPVREHYRTQYLTALEALARLHLEQAAYVQAARYSRQRLAVDRCWEGGHQVLMAVYAHTGRRTAALRQYQALERCLAEELDVAPGQASRELYAWIVEKC